MASPRRAHGAQPGARALISVLETHRPSSPHSGQTPPSPLPSFVLRTPLRIERLTPITTMPIARSELADCAVCGYSTTHGARYECGDECVLSATAMALPVLIFSALDLSVDMADLPIPEASLPINKQASPSNALGLSLVPQQRLHQGHDNPQRSESTSISVHDSAHAHEYDGSAYDCADDSGYDYDTDTDMNVSDFLYGVFYRHLCYIC